MIRRILSQQKNLDSRYMFTWENYKLDKMQRFNACSSLGICGDWTRIFLFSSYYPCPCPCRGFYAFSPDFCDLISSLESCDSISFYSMKMSAFYLGRFCSYQAFVSFRRPPAANLKLSGQSHFLASVHLHLGGRRVGSL